MLSIRRPPMRRSRITRLVLAAAALTLTACQPEEGGRILLKSPEVDDREVGGITLPIRNREGGISVRVPLVGDTNSQAYEPKSNGLCLDLPHTVFSDPVSGNPILNGNDKYEITADDPCLRNGIVLTLRRKHA